MLIAYNMNGRGRLPLLMTNESEKPYSFQKLKNKKGKVVPVLN
jgi:hypothetical protein